LRHISSVVASPHVNGAGASRTPLMIGWLAAELSYVHSRRMESPATIGSGSLN